MHYYGLFTSPSNLDTQTETDYIDSCLFSNRTELVLAMELQLVLLTMGLLTTCLPSGKMECGGGHWEWMGRSE